MNPVTHKALYQALRKEALKATYQSMAIAPTESKQAIAEQFVDLWKQVKEGDG